MTREAQSKQRDAALRRVQAHLAAGVAVRQECLRAHTEKIAAAACLVIEAVLRGGRIYLFGNGGSAADAQHLAAEFVGKFACPRTPIPAVALTTDTSVLTSIANDFGYDQVFARQVEALVREGDVAIALSTSGGSASVVRGAEAARRAGARVIALTGRDGGTLAALVDVAIQAPSEQTALIQEAHIAIGHAICATVEEAWVAADR
ncbi:MAG: SIS domain-containing protein [bacterium]|nr:SIS domain-containing protein [bacterium]